MTVRTSQYPAASHAAASATNGDNENYYATAVLIDTEDTPVTTSSPSTAPHSSAAAVPTAQLVVPQTWVKSKGNNDDEEEDLQQPTIIPNPQVVQGTFTTADPPRRRRNNHVGDGPTQTIVVSHDFLVHEGNGRTRPATSEEIEQIKTRLRRQHRRARGAFFSTMGGIVIGGVLLGPLGIILGGLGAPMITTAALRNGERRKDKRVAQAKAAKELQSHVVV